MRWSSRLGDPQIGLPLVHHSGGLNSVYSSLSLLMMVVKVATCVVNSWT